MQNTVNKSFSLSGVTLHGGLISNVSVHPATANTGIVFRRTDLKVPHEEALVEASYDNVMSTELCTKLSNSFGNSISTIEHIMSAFHGMGIDNAIVEVDCNELPILDGSSIEYVLNIEKVGIKSLNIKKNILTVVRPIIFNLGDSYIKVTPSNNFIIDYTIVYDHDLINKQKFIYQFKDQKQYKRLISNCRTFGFKHEVENLRDKGLIAGGSLDNAILLDKTGIVNNEKLRHKDEFVKHKILDFIGDIYLLGMSIKGNFEIYKGGHNLTQQLMHSLMSDKSNYKIVQHQDSNVQKYSNKFHPKPIAVSL